MLISCESQNSKIDVDETMTIVQQQYSNMLEEIDGEDLLPRSAENGKIRLVKPRDWTSGFFPGTMWYMYEYSKDEKWKEAAIQYTELLEDIQFNTGTHDVGFMMYSSYGNGLRLTKNEDYKKILIQSAKSLSTRYNPKIGCIRSWDWNAKTWQFPVIIDNMMNLELLMWAFDETRDSTFWNVAVSHANTTMKNHYRDDMSSWHVVDYDTLTGEPRMKQTHQGLSDESTWSRGQSWGLYGFVMMYYETQKPEYLDHAIKIAEFLMNHSNLPSDKVPYWDYDVTVKDEPRDASAAALMASSLYRMSGYISENKDKYIVFADEIMKSLTSDKYLSEVGSNGNFILMHSTGSKPSPFEVDAPLNYADYYFVEALLRRLELASIGY